MSTRESEANEHKLRWNRCNACGKYISMRDFASGAAMRKMITPDSEFTKEEFETLCRHHAASITEDIING